jgi:hypothetical protein
MLNEDGVLRCWSEIEEVLVLLLASASKQALGGRIKRVTNARLPAYLSSSMILVRCLPMGRICLLAQGVQSVVAIVDWSSSWSDAVVFVNEEESYTRRSKEEALE